MVTMQPRSQVSPFFVIRFTFSTCTEVEECEKQRSPGNTYDVMMSGEREVNVGGRSPHSRLDFIIEHSNDSQDPRCSRSTILDFTVRKSLYGLLHTNL